MPSEKSCGAVIFRRDGAKKYLLLHYEGGHWDFVKGHVEKGENERETTLRETEEETGITDLKFIEGYRESISYFYRRAGRTVRKEVVFYLLETNTEQVRLSREHVGFDWLTYDRAMERLTYKNAKDTLQKAQDFLATQPTKEVLGEKSS
ncbi:MAG: NUDIX domain-containing protein [Candidatus Bathyarchaeia archaeon]|jgi:8-oxo-dGTP pyrophosphatase MutT (NUDIX family)